MKVVDATTQVVELRSRTRCARVSTPLLKARARLMNTMRLSVVDAMDGPHGGRILRLRQLTGDPLSTRKLRNARLRARSPQGHERTCTVDHFALFGGRVSDQRLARTGRIDVAVLEDPTTDGVPQIGLRWQIEFI